MANYTLYGKAVYFGLITITRKFTSEAKAYDWVCAHYKGWRSKHSICGVFKDEYYTKPLYKGSEAVNLAGLGINGMYLLLTSLQYEQREHNQ